MKDRYRLLTAEVQPEKQDAFEVTVNAALKKGQLEVRDLLQLQIYQELKTKRKDKKAKDGEPDTEDGRRKVGIEKVMNNYQKQKKEEHNANPKADAKAAGGSA